MVNCPDCKLFLIQHILKYIKKRGYCKGALQEEVKDETTTEVKTVKEPPGLTKQKPTKTITNITDDIVNTYVKENTQII